MERIVEGSLVDFSRAAPSFRRSEQPASREEQAPRTISVLSILVQHRRPLSLHEIVFKRSILVRIQPSRSGLSSSKNVVSSLAFSRLLLQCIQMPILMDIGECSLLVPPHLPIVSTLPLLPSLRRRHLRRRQLRRHSSSSILPSLHRRQLRCHSPSSVGWLR